jgi:hypothetical protein
MRQGALRSGKETLKTLEGQNLKNAKSLKGWLWDSERKKTPRESTNSEGGRSRRGKPVMVAFRSLKC